MLEENIKSGTMSPAEVALNVSSFLSVELAGQSPIAEARFFSIFQMLCTRVFGEINSTQGYRHEGGSYSWMNRQYVWVRPSSSSMTTSSSSSSRVHSSISRSSSSSSSSRGHSSSSGSSSSSFSSSIRSDPVVLLLGSPLLSSSSSSSSSRSTQQQSQSRQNRSSTTTSSLSFLQALAMEAAHRPNVRYRFLFHALPENVQSDWIALINTTVWGSNSGGGGGGIVDHHHQRQQALNGANGGNVGGNRNKDTIISTNSLALLGQLFRVGPAEQQELIQYIHLEKMKKQQQRDGGGGGNGQLHVVNGSTSPFLTSPTSALGNQSLFGSPIGHQQQQQQLGGNSNSNNATSSSSSLKGKDKLPNVQLSMLEYYLLMFLRYPLYPPVTDNTNSSRNSTTTNSSSSSRGRQTTTRPYGELVYEEILKSYVDYYIPVRALSGSFHGFEALSRPNELFIRLIIALWLEGQNQLSTTDEAIHMYRQRRGGGGMITSAAANSIGLDKSYELVHGTCRPLRHLSIRRALFKIVGRVVIDGSLHDKTKDLYNDIGTTGRDGNSNVVLCLSPTMTMLQLPFYNYIRAVFRYESVHTSSSNPSTFHEALKLWLMWIEPWNARFPAKKSQSSTSRIVNSVSSRSPFKSSNSTAGGPSLIIPKAKQASSFKAMWEPYIASNLHLYTVPLALFLRRAREFDFSSKHYKVSVETILRVLRVFSPEVVSVINRLLQSRQSSEISSPPVRYYEFVRKHEQNLGLYAPPVDGTTWSLTACQNDMKIILDEVYSQHTKKAEELDFFDKIEASISEFFGGLGASVGEEKELQFLVAKAKVVVGFDRDFTLVPSSSTKLAAQSNGRVGQLTNAADSTLVRCQDGDFSDIGRSEILQGLVKCNVEDLDSYGDPMRYSVQTYENAVLVDLLVQLSDYLNGKLHHDSIMAGNATVGKILTRLLPRRVNLRFLADYRNDIAILMFAWFCLMLIKLFSLRT